MSETERQKLQVALAAKLSDAGNGKDLSSLIIGMSEVKRCELLERLSNWYNLKISKLIGRSKHLELRGYPRKPIKIPVELSKNGFTFLCFTQNISKSGAFIQTDFSFDTDQKINMILSPPKTEKDITAGGKIIRVDSIGIGVKFDQLIPDFWQYL
ncbi:MAG: PilZ domain-containing protein [Desulfobacterales bacterium]